MKLSIVVPVYNEERTLEEIVGRVLATPYDKEVLLVDDGSRDQSRAIIARLVEAHPEVVRSFLHEQNGGKGAALQTGFAAVEGDFVVVQDADLEYDPADYGALLAPLETGEADVVYGSRFLGRSERVHFRLHTLANRILTGFSNLFTGYRLTDMETCYKVFPAAVARSLKLRSRAFTIEPELTAAFARRRLRIVEVPIHYENRGYEEGKKIGWRDGVAALLAIVRFRFFP
jgi:glycosyltransferase involved in cell wall biosynthesis